MTATVTAPQLAPSRLAVLRRRMSRADLEALGYWAGAHLTFLILAWASAWAFRSQRSRGTLAPFEQWDAVILRGIAAHGYFAQGPKAHDVAFFPGWPLALAAIHLVLRNWAASELVLAGAASLAAMVAVTRLAGTSRAALILAVMPAGVFLFAGYAEPLFLALAVPAWLAARRGRFLLAGWLALAAGLARPDGVWLTAALAVMALTGSAPRVLSAARACLGFLGPAAYECYLCMTTGTPWAWSRAQQAGWDMHAVWPWKSWQTTWWISFEHPYGAQYALEFQVQMAAVVVVAAAVAAFGVSRRWPEFTACALALASAVSATWLESTARLLLVLFPVAVAVARWPRMARAAWLWACVPLAVVTGLAYLMGQWAG